MIQNRMLRTRAAVFAGVLTASLMGGAIAAAPATSAASYPTCNGVKTVKAGGTDTVKQPYHKGSDTRNCILKYGNESSAVKELQFNLLHCHNLSTGGLDGIYGDKTREAVEAVQRDAKIDVDGIYGPDTRKAMDWYFYRNGDPGRSCLPGSFIG
ncbi:hypothetical protein SUDANB51_05020 [Streptomyces sp. enrichment culture]